MKRHHFAAFALVFILLLGGCADSPRPPEMVAKDYLMAISEGDENVIYYVKQFAQKPELSITDQEKIHAILLPARFATLKKGGLKDIRITDIEPLDPDTMRVSYTLVFYKDYVEESGALTLERTFINNDYEWLIIE